MFFENFRQVSWLFYLSLTFHSICLKGHQVSSHLCLLQLSVYVFLFRDIAFCFLSKNFDYDLAEKDRVDWFAECFFLYMWFVNP